LLESISPDDPVASRRLFTEVVEPLADSFEPAAVVEYVRLFSELMARVHPDYDAAELRARYERIRRPRECAISGVRRVFVLSRVTLGADVAVTSVLLCAMKRRFPAAQICFVGSKKAWELFEGDPRIHHVAAPYERSGTLAGRLAASRRLETLLAHPESIVVDPDSRLTQLGLAPVCPEERYFFFESRAYPGRGSIGELAARWLSDTFGVAGSRAYLAPALPADPPADVTVSLGVGENPKKRLTDEFERQLLETIAAGGFSILIDKGAGGEESERVERAIDGLANIRTWQGAFARFAAQIMRSRFYVGYDSAGQHVAAASGVSLVTIFAGYPNERFLERWRPTGPGQIEVVTVP
jgi:ADP-heptose:LPS heptosyltransferase